MKFCPYCSNLLLIEKTENLRYYCKTCPYVLAVKKEFTSYNFYENNKSETIMGEKEIWENVSKTDATCRKCENDKAYFKEIQIRSADEPATLFFKCSNRILPSDSIHISKDRSFSSGSKSPYTLLKSKFLLLF